MLDRFPTEMILLVIDATSSGAWQRKAMLEILSLVSKAYRSALRPLRESVVHVPKASVIPLLRSWPSAARKAVVTVLVGTNDQAKALERFSLRDYSRLLSVLPHVKYIYLQRVDEGYSHGEQLASKRMWFELNASNPFKQCLSLSLRKSNWYFSQTLEFPRFKLRRLRLELVWEGAGARTDEDWGSGVDQFLTTRCLPCLRELRISCRQLPTISTDFINQLDAAQVDFCRTADVETSGVQQLSPSSAPVLISFDAPFFYPSSFKQNVEGVTFARVRAAHPWNLGLAIKRMPQLKALSFQIAYPEVSTNDSDSLSHRFSSDMFKRIQGNPVELFGAEVEAD